MGCASLESLTVYRKIHPHDLLNHVFFGVDSLARAPAKHVQGRFPWHNLTCVDEPNRGVFLPPVRKMAPPLQGTLHLSEGVEQFSGGKKTPLEPNNALPGGRTIFRWQKDSSGAKQCTTRGSNNFQVAKRLLWSQTMHYQGVEQFSGGKKTPLEPNNALPGGRTIFRWQKDSSGAKQCTTRGSNNFQVAKRLLWSQTMHYQGVEQFSGGKKTPLEPNNALPGGRTIFRWQKDSSGAKQCTTRGSNNFQVAKRLLWSQTMHYQGVEQFSGGKKTPLEPNNALPGGRTIFRWQKDSSGAKQCTTRGSNNFQVAKRLLWSQTMHYQGVEQFSGGKKTPLEPNNALPGGRTIFRWQKDSSGAKQCTTRGSNNFQVAKRPLWGQRSNHTSRFTTQKWMSKRQTWLKSMNLSEQRALRNRQDHGP